MSELLDGFLDDYFAEAEEHLASIRKSLLALEQSMGQPRLDAAVLEELFRSFHSLKGIAGMVDHRETEAVAHELESFLRALREGEARLTPTGMDVLVQAARALEDSIAARRAGEAPRDTATVSAELSALVTGDGERVETVASRGDWICVFTPSPALIARGVNVDVVRARLREIGEIVSASPTVNAEGTVSFTFEFLGSLTDEVAENWRADGMVCARADRQPAPAPAETERRQSAMLSSGHLVRVDLARLDDLMRMIGNLVILRARLNDNLARVEPYVPASLHRDIQEDGGAIERELRGLREGVMRVRMVPVGEIFRRMPFVVRDLARETGRSVNVVLSGQDTQIDKYLVERMMDPVMHLVRNAVSHGIETPEERIAAGKPAAATLRLSAAASGETVVLEISDDGRGVAVDRVIERARQAGLPVPSGTADSAALLDLISSPGFSTRDDSDRLSGRGFGMNVVRETLRELGGTIRLETVRGEGTRFLIELPLTLAIAAAMIARVGDQIFAVPQSAVREVAEFETAGIRQLQGAEVVEFRGAPLPVLRLSTVLNLPPSGLPTMHAFIIGAGSSAVGLLVDRIVAHREIVVRSTADPLIKVDAITGATDLGDGRAVLILDAAAIARGAREHGLTVAGI